MDPLPIQHLADACQGELLAGAPETLVGRVGTDSRQTRPGDLFVALVGEHHDGHTHIPQAVARGAVGVLVMRTRLAPLPAGCAVIGVEDSRRALGDLGARYRADFDIPIVAVGGSNGKTTTKDLIGSVLGQGLPCLVSEASYNNDIGVPLTLLRMSRAHRAAVLEAGTNHPGELAPLLRQIRPTHGVLTSLGREHLEFFGDLEGVVREEGWLGEVLPASGTLFVNADAPGLADVVARTRARVVRVGWALDADWRAVSAEFTAGGMRFEARTPAAAYDGAYAVPAWGRHQAINALLAIAVGAMFGLTRRQIEAGLEAFRPPKMRLQLTECRGISLLDDCYNANADSMAAALETLRALPCRGRRLAVLGDMAELGDHAPAAHAEVGRRAALAAERLIAVGRMAPVMARAAREAGMGAVAEWSDAEAAVADLATTVRPGDLVLVKASRATRLERVVEALKTRWEGGGI